MGWDGMGEAVKVRLEVSHAWWRFRGVVDGYLS